MNAKLEMEVYMKATDGCGERSGKVVKLERAPYGVKQTGRQLPALFFKTIVDKFGMELCRVDPHVFRKMENKEVVSILVVHIDDLLVLEMRQCVKSCSMSLMAIFPFKISGSWDGTWGML